MLDPRLLQRLNDKKDQLDAMRPLSKGILSRLREQLDLEWIYNSNAIEGSTLTLQETRLILETGLTIGGKSMREHFEVTNQREAIAYVEDLASQRLELKPYHVRQIHYLELTQVDDQNAGRYRETPVRIVGAEHIPPEAWEITRWMSEWSDELVHSLKDHHPVIASALAHHRLVAMHPFVDGNGRTARLVMNLILMQLGYPPTVIERVHRRQYYRVLAQADSGHFPPLVNFVGRAVERSLLLYLDAATPQTAPARNEDLWIPLRVAADESPYSQEYLSLLARKGRLEALKKGRNWVTTRKAVLEYIQSLENDETE